MTAKKFWKIVAATNEVENPLKHSDCLSHPTPDSTPSDSIEDFIAYGMRSCWLSPETFPLWPHLRENDIRALRKAFLGALSHSLVANYKGQPHVYTDRMSVMENTITVKAGIEWTGLHDADDAYSMKMTIHYPRTESGKGWAENEVIYLYKSAIEDKRRVRAALTWALYYVDNGVSFFHQPWDTLKIERLLPKVENPAPNIRTEGYPHADVNEFGRWYSKIPAIE